jgi:serine protease
MHNVLIAAALAIGLLGSVQAQTGPGPVHGLIVQLKPAAQSQREAPQAARERMRSVAGAAGVAMQDERIVGSGHHLLRLPQALSGEALEAAVRRLRLHPDVSAVEPDVRIRRRAVPNDPGIVNQWYLQPPSVFPGAINAPAAWDVTTGRAQRVVAVLDVGTRPSHPELAGKLLPGYDFVSEISFANDGDGRDADASDPGDWVSPAETLTSPFRNCEPENSSWHGTFIAGQIAALTDNAAGIAGIDWQGKVLPVRIAGKCGALLSDLLDGMRWAAGLPVAGVPANPNPARVLNLSFGGAEACTSSYQAVIDEIGAAGALLVVAGGNSASPPGRPADCRGVLAVGAVQEDGRKAAYADLGPAIGITAPGGTATRAIFSIDNSGSTVPGFDTYGLKAGTSFSSPMVAATASLMLAVNPSLTPAQLIERIQSSARPHVVVDGSSACSAANPEVCNCTTATCGAGLLDTAAAVQAANPGAVPVAAIRPVVSPAVGASVVLDGSESIASSGATLVGYAWTQTQGPTVTIVNPTSARASVQLPASAATFAFRLVVTDSAGRTDDAEVGMTSTGGSGGSDDGGGGATGWWWGAALWAVAAIAWLRRRRIQSA